MVCLSGLSRLFGLSGVTGKRDERHVTKDESRARVEGERLDKEVRAHYFVVPSLWFNSIILRLQNSAILWHSSPKSFLSIGSDRTSNSFA